MWCGDAAGRDYLTRMQEGGDADTTRFAGILSNPTETNREAAREPALELLRFITPFGVGHFSHTERAQAYKPESVGAWADSVHWSADLSHMQSWLTDADTLWVGEYMARHGGAASWLFLPYISCGQVIPRHRLHRLELKIIGLYPNSLNRMRHSGSPYKAVPAGGQASVLLCVWVWVWATMCMWHDEQSLAVVEWRCECRWLMPMGLCCL